MATGTIEMQGLKSATFSGTTDSGGDISLGFSVSSGKIVVQAYTKNAVFLAIPRASTSGNWFINCQKYSSGNWTVASNQTVSGTYYYLEL